jgi:DNA-binding NarL/FixJ family response regulator
MGGTVLIVDDHVVFRSRVRRMLEADGFDVIGEAGDIAEGLASAAQLTPDIVLLDIHLPDGSGLDAARQFAEGSPPRQVVIVSTYDAEDVGDITSRGAHGFISKAELSGQALAAALGTPV